MSKILKVSQGDYRLQVQSGGHITLDTGTATGTVIITGNLDVKGITTTVESTNTTIADNIIQLNYGQTGNGISSTLSYVSGIEVERGNYPAAQLLFSESVLHYNPIVAQAVGGTFVMKTADGTLSGLQVGAIANDGTTDLILDLQNSTQAVLIANSPAYESHVTADNHVITKKYLSQYVAASGFPSGVATVDRIFYPTNATVGTAYTSIQAFGSSINFSISQTLIAAVSAAGFSVGNINSYQDTITNTSNSNPLTLTATNYNVEINGILLLDNQSTGNVASYGAVAANKTKIYASATVGPGKTGLYIANTTTSDELVSKNRAVLLSILL